MEMRFQKIELHCFIQGIPIQLLHFFLWYCPLMYNVSLMPLQKWRRSFFFSIRYCKRWNSCQRHHPAYPGASQRRRILRLFLLQVLSTIRDYEELKGFDIDENRPGGLIFVVEDSIIVSYSIPIHYEFKAMSVSSEFSWLVSKELS